jgi:hypothetical protein
MLGDGEVIEPGRMCSVSVRSEPGPITSSHTMERARAPYPRWKVLPLAPFGGRGKRRLYTYTYIRIYTAKNTLWIRNKPERSLFKFNIAARVL